MQQLQLTTNFRASEFACHSGDAVPEVYFNNLNALAFNLQIIRDHLNKPVEILSGYRTPEYNKKVGGAPRSQHLLCKAADLHVEGYTPARLHLLIENLIREEFIKQGGLGLYSTFVHYDIRGFKARWDFSKGNPYL